MEDLGQPSSYLQLEPGMPVYSAEGEELGRVESVRSDPERDIFDGIVVRQGMVLGPRRLVEAEKVEEIFERGIVLKIESSAAAGLAEIED